MAVETRQNASLTLYVNGKIVVTLKMADVGVDVGTPQVSLINGEIVLGGGFGYIYEQLIVFNKELEELKRVRGTTANAVYSLAGNENYIGYGDENGRVRYHSRTGGFEHEVSEFINFESYLQGFLQTSRPSCFGRHSKFYNRKWFIG